VSDEQPAFWFGFEVAWAKLAVARVCVFGLLALDALDQIRHAPRYGAGGFNVAQLPGLDALGPGRVAYGACELMNAYIFVLAAFGAARRGALGLAAALYAWLYFGSQLDSYQHHYLVALVLVIACCVPWQRPAQATPATPVRAWAVRLWLVQLAVMYLWAAISKLNPTWLHGTALDGQIHGPLRSLIDATIGLRATAWLVVLTELVLAATVWWRRAWPIVAPIGLGFHLAIVFTGLEIGLFAWLMIAMYALVVPDRVWVWLLARLEPVRARLAGIALGTAARLGAIAAAVVLGIVLAALCRFEDALGLAIVLGLVVAGAALARRRTWLCIAHVAAIATWLAVDRASTIAVDYYKFWGGDARRLGERADAEHAYRRLIAIAPDDAAAHFQLGRVLLVQGDASGLDELHVAEQLEPDRARSLVLEARWLAGHGDRAAALAKARAAVAAEPGDREAQAVLARLAR